MSKNADQKVTLILKLEVEGKGVIQRIITSEDIIANILDEAGIFDEEIGKLLGYFN